MRLGIGAKSGLLLRLPVRTVQYSTALHTGIVFLYTHKFDIQRVVSLLIFGFELFQLNYKNNRHKKQSKTILIILNFLSFFLAKFGFLPFPKLKVGRVEGLVNRWPRTGRGAPPTTQLLVNTRKLWR